MTDYSFNDELDPNDQEGGQDFCRVCRCEGAPDKPLFHPCLCTGSIKFIHQECLVQWLKYSKREYCELCQHRFTFQPIYSPDMPKRLPLRVILTGVATSVARAVGCWLHYTLVALAWLGVVPLTACRIYRCLFTGSVNSLLTLPLDLLSSEHLVSDCLQGLAVVLASLATFIGYVWLKEQILQIGGPDWLHQDRRQDGQRRRQPLFPGLLNALGGGGPPVGAQQEEAAPGHGEAAGEDESDEEDEGSDEEDAAGNAAPVVNPAPGAGDVAGLLDGGGGMEWERAAEELTWERLLGLDGSLVFLEHVFWVVSLNTLFILVFAFCPYHIGHFTVVGFKLESMVEATRMDGLVTTLVGYVILASLLVLLHCVMRIGSMNKARHLAGLGYLVIKVALLTVMEVGVFPVFCGLWMDVCSMGMFNATLTQRGAIFQYAPVTFVFMHWMVGMMYIFYFASFLLLLREVLRPGVFWFLRNFNDPEFNPVHDMIVQPVHRHFRRFLINCTLFGTIIVLMVWLPVRGIKRISPEFLPYTFNISHDSPLDYSVEIFFLQVVLPLVFDSHAKLWLKSIVRVWCTGVAWILDIRSYLLGDEPFKTGDIIVYENGRMQRITNAPAEGAVPQPPDAGEAAPGAVGNTFKTYRRPHLFPLRVACLLFCLCASLFLFSLAVLTLPVECGRKTLSQLPMDTKHDLFALLVGLIGLGMVVKLIFSFPLYLEQRGANLLRHALNAGRYIMVALKMVLLGVIFLGLVPAALGLLFNFIFITPFRVPLHKTLVIGFWEHWIFGVMHLKAWVLFLLVGPRWWLREVLDRVQDEIMRRENMRITHVLWDASPVLTTLTMALGSPYLAARMMAPLAGMDSDLLFRRIYPCVFTILLIVSAVHFQLRQFRRLYEHIKNDRYLVGQRLVNYEYERNRAH